MTYCGIRDLAGGLAIPSTTVRKVPWDNPPNNRYHDNQYNK